MFRFVAAVAAALMVSACANPAPPAVRIDVPFNSEEARAMLQPGPNSITGSALIRQRGGGVVTCAGNVVHLVPATAYAQRRMATIYGSQKIARHAVNFADTPPGYVEATRTTTCNAQGFFRFDGLRDGEYFVQTFVVWTVGRYDSRQGGSLYERVAISGGRTADVTLSP